MIVIGCTCSEQQASGDEIQGNRNSSTDFMIVSFSENS